MPPIIMDDFLKPAPTKMIKPKAVFSAVFLFYEASLYSLALFAWQNCDDSIKKTNLYENYLWYQSLVFMLQNNFQRAHDFLSYVTKQFPNSDEIEKYNYFIGYSLQEINKKNQGDAILSNLAEKSPPTYYVQLARQTLDLAPLKGAKLPGDALEKHAKLSPHSDGKNATLLFGLGFKEEARDLILRSSMSSDDKLASLSSLGFYNDAFSRSPGLKTLKIQIDELKAPHTMRAAFPLPHPAIMDDMSKKYNINKNLLYAIMKTESSFSEEATSPRGARGLMQMMPFVATDLASHLALNEFHNDHLTDPKTAIELGALLVATLKRQFDDHHLVVAAYNAGAHQVRKWKNLFGHLPTELFIERIPFKQTRDYVKKVLLGESLYHALDGRICGCCFSFPPKTPPASGHLI